jgi:pyrophosphatase PpaX
MPYTHALFDLDGTLVDTIPLIRYAYAATLAAHPEFGASGEQAMKRIGLPLRQILAELVPPQWVETCIAEYLAHYRSRHDELLRGYPGMRDVVTALAAADVRMGVVTSKARATTLMALEAEGIADLMGVIVAAEDTTIHKPQPEPILLAMSSLGSAESRHTAYVGDSPFDMQAAKAAGVCAVAVTWGAFTEQELRAAEPDHLLRSPGELLGLIAGR